MPVAASRARAPAPGFEIWQSPRGVHSETNPIRMAILAQLERGPKTMGDLAKATARGKPTLSSLHIPALQNAGLVTETTDPNDARIKWYKLAGSRLGSSTVDPAALREAVLEFVRRRGLVPLALLLDVIDPAGLAASADLDYVNAVATRLGAIVGRTLTATAPKERLQELSAILSRNGLGEVAGTPAAPKVQASRGQTPFVTALVKAALPPPQA